MPVRIAVRQQETVPRAVDANRVRALGFAREALAGGAGLILFHERLFVGYVENLRDLAEEVNGPTQHEILKGTDSLVLYGLTEREGADCYVSATLVGASGVVANYRKTHLWWRSKGLRHEGPVSTSPGDALVTFDLKGHKCGIMICYDGLSRDDALLRQPRLRNRLLAQQPRSPRLRRTSRANSMIIAASCVAGTRRATNAKGPVTSPTPTESSSWKSAAAKACFTSNPERVPQLGANNPWYVGRGPKCSTDAAGAASAG